MKFWWHYVCVSCVVLLLTACSQQEKKSPVKINRLDIAMDRYATLDADGRDSIVRSMRPGIDALFFIMGINSVNDSTLQDYSQSPIVKIFTPDVLNRFSSLDSIDDVLSKINYRISKEMPSIKMSEIYSIVSPYNQSIYMVDSVMLVALNHYMDADYIGYSSFEKYIKVLKTPKYLPYDIVEALVANKYPYNHDTDATILNRLLYEGSIVEAKMELVPDASVADALGYDKEQFSWMQANEADVWNAIVSRKLLYSTSISDMERLVAPAPRTTILHQEAPGRAGRYIGYRIVESYKKQNPDVSLDFLLSPAFYNDNKTLIASKYSPTR